MNQMWGHICILNPRRWRQDSQDFETSLNYVG